MVKILIWAGWVLSAICAAIVAIGCFRLTALLWRERVNLHSVIAMALIGVAVYGAYFAAGMWLLQRVI